jgi:hypothetical protein
VRSKQAAVQAIVVVIAKFEADAFPVIRWRFSNPDAAVNQTT